MGQKYIDGRSRRQYPTRTAVVPAWLEVDYSNCMIILSIRQCFRISRLSSLGEIGWWMCQCWFVLCLWNFATNRLSVSWQANIQGRILLQGKRGRIKKVYWEQFFWITYSRSAFFCAWTVLTLRTALIIWMSLHRKALDHLRKQYTYRKTLIFWIYENRRCAWDEKILFSSKNVWHYVVTHTDFRSNKHLIWTENFYRNPSCFVNENEEEMKKSPYKI